MSRFYKTAKAAPIVDYTVEYPFDDLFKATKYRNELQDTRTDKLNKAYDDVLGLNFIPGTTDANGNYMPSPSEQYVKQKRSQVEDLINNYSNVDLTKSSWGNINREISTLTNDPQLADIQTSYNNYIKNQAHQRQLDIAGKLNEDTRWGPSGDPTTQMWDVQNQGIYPFQPSAAFHDPSTLLERYYKDMNVDEIYDPISGLLKKEVKTADLERVSSGVDETFLSTPEGQDAVSNFRRLNPDLYAMSDVDVAKQVVLDYGQKYLGMDLSGGKSGSNTDKSSGKFELGVAPGSLQGTEWALNNNTVTTSEIMDKVATPLGDGTYTVDAGTEVYINPLETGRTGDTDDLWLAYNMGIAKQYQTETFDIQTKLDALVYPVKPYQGGETIKIETAKRNLELQIKKYDQDGDGDITEADLPGGKSNAKVIQFYDRVEYYENRAKKIEDAHNENIAKYNASKLEYNNILDSKAVEYAGLYSVDVQNEELVKLLENWTPGSDIEDLDLSKEDMHSLMAMELSDLAGRGGIWQHINNAATKNMIVDRDENNLPVSAKFINGNMVFTGEQLEAWFTERGYGEEGTWFGWDTGADDWDNAFV